MSNEMNAEQAVNRIKTLVKSIPDDDRIIQLRVGDIEKGAFLKAVSALEKQIAKPLKKEPGSRYTVGCPTCGARYGLSSNRSGSDEEYCFYCGQLLPGWNAKVKKNKKSL